MKKESIEITLVDGEPKYAKALLDFYKEVGKETDYLSFDENGLGVNQAQEEQYLKSLKESLNNRLLIALLGDEIIGVASIGSPYTPRDRHVGELGIVIKQRFWGFGLSRVLMEDLIDWAKESSILSILRLEVAESNIRAIELYKKYGFQETGRIPKGIKREEGEEDSLLMVLPLTEE